MERTAERVRRTNSGSLNIPAARSSFSSLDLLFNFGIFKEKNTSLIAQKNTILKCRIPSDLGTRATLAHTVVAVTGAATASAPGIT